MISKPGSNAGKIVVYGAGGHGLVVAEAAAAAAWEVLGFLDDRLAAAGAPALVIGASRWSLLDPHVLDDPSIGVIVAIGDNAARQRIAGQLHAGRRTLVNIIHPAASVSPSVTLGRGVFVSAGAVVNAAATLEDGVIVNSGAVVEHHNTIGAYAHIAPRAALAGKVTVGERTLVGIGASVLPGVCIGKGSTVGAGAVVCHQVPDGVTVTGVPARIRG